MRKYILMVIGLSYYSYANDPQAVEKEILELLKKTIQSEQLTQGEKELLNTTISITDKEPTWPLLTYMYGEILHKTKSLHPKPETVYQQLLEWAVKNKNKNKWQGSALITASSWRWISELLEKEKRNPSEAKYCLDTVKNVMNAKYSKQMFDDPFIESLPQFREEIWKKMAQLAWNNDFKDESTRYYLEYLKIATKDDTNKVTIQIQEHLLESGVATPAGLALFRGKQCFKLNQQKLAQKYLKISRETANPQTKTEAEFYLALTEIPKVRGSKRRTKVAEMFQMVYEDSSNPRLAQRALYEKARLLYRAGPGRDSKTGLEDLLTLTETYPKGPYTDDALDQLALISLNKGDLEQALSYFTKLQNFDGPNDWLNLSYFRPAIALYELGDTESLNKASRSLQDLEKKNPRGPIYYNALFWRGKIALALGNEEEANGYYRRIVEECPYDYYAIRSRMHLNLGERAEEELNPDQKTIKELSELYQQGSTFTEIKGTSLYHHRLKRALETGFYETVYVALDRLRHTFPGKLMMEVPLDDLDKKGLLADLVILLSLRQDAFSAMDAEQKPHNKIQLSLNIKKYSEDVFLALSLVMGPATHSEKTSLQQEKAYLRAAYPKAYLKELTQASKEYKLPQELLYSMIKRESRFNPSALSREHALGLFQFIPWTFKRLDQRWGLLKAQEKMTMESYLFNPKLNIQLGARVIKEDYLRRFKQNMLLSIANHNAGGIAVKNWNTKWQKSRKNKDIELFVEMCNYSQTRIFLRKVITNMAIVKASDIFNTSQR